MTSTVDRQVVESLKGQTTTYLEAACGITNTRKAFRCLVPGHEDKHPSMRFDERTQRVHCFACGASGDVFDVAKWVAGASSFREQVEEVASAVGYFSELAVASGECANKGLHRDEAERVGPFEQRDCFPEIVRACENLFRPQGAMAREMLRERGFDPEEILRIHGIGWARHPNDVMPGRFTYAPERQAGYLCIPFPSDADWSSVRYAVFRPVEWDGKGPKEMKPKGLPCPVYREHLLSGSGEHGTILVSEGPFDAISLDLLYPGTGSVALCGSSRSRFVEACCKHAVPKSLDIVLALDCDEAGRRMTQALAADLEAIGVVPRLFGPFPGGAKDANEFYMSLKAKGVSGGANRK